MEPRASINDGLRGGKLDSELANMKPEPQECETSDIIRFIPDWHYPDIDIKVGLSEDDGAAVIFPDCSYSNPESAHEAEDELTVTQYISTKIVDGKSSKDASSPDLFLETDFSMKEKRESDLLEFVGVEERNENQGREQETISFEAGGLSFDWNRLITTKHCLLKSLRKIYGKKISHGLSLHSSKNKKTLHPSITNSSERMYQDQNGEEIRDEQIESEQDNLDNWSKCLNSVHNIEHVVCSQETPQNSDVGAVTFIDSNDSSYEKVLENDRTVFRCKNCRKDFASKQSALRHNQTVHLKLKQYECQHCGQRFGHKYNLWTHNQTVHLKVKQYECEHCGQRFGRNCDIKRHIQIIHLKVKQFECQHCGQRFGHSSAMHAHVQTVHLKEKHYECHICGQKFGRKSHVKKHVRNIHLNERHKCQYCEQKFRWSCDMKKHVLTVHPKQKHIQCVHLK